MDYDKLLDSAYSQIKKVESNGERFEIPIFESIIEGNKTIISNINVIASKLTRDVNHIIKFLTRQLAAQATFRDNRLVFNRKISRKQLQEKLELYVNEFVICSECGKPDTELVKQDRLMFMQCSACGAKHSVRAKI